MVKSPDHISSINPYVPGKPVEEVERELGIKDSVKLASNENPLGPSPMAIEAIRTARLDLHRYPDSGGYYLTRKLADRHGVHPSQIILGNGSNEILNLIAYAYMTEKDSAVMAWPSFIVYPLATQYVGAESIKVDLKEMRHDLGSMASALKENTKIVFIANPNNPTGTMNGRDEFEAFMQAVPEGILVVVDEAYYEYVTSQDYPDSLAYLKKGRDIVILRTFSKIHGLAGLRIGYGISTTEIVTELNKVRAPFNTNTVAQVAAMAALDDTAHLERSFRTNEEGKNYLYEELKKLAVRFVPTETNFIFIVLDSLSANDVFEKLMKKGVIIRPMGEKAFRLTIGTPEENTKFINALKEVL